MTVKILNIVDCECGKTLQYDEEDLIKEAVKGEFKLRRGCDSCSPVYNKYIICPNCNRKVNFRECIWCDGVGFTAAGVMCRACSGTGRIFG